MNCKMIITVMLAAAVFSTTTLSVYGAESKPVEGTIDSSVLGSKGGYIHPFLSIAEAHTDNIYNTRDNKVSDFKTIISPGIWLAAPRHKKQLLKIDTSSFTPGGLNIDIHRPTDFRRYQTYLLASSDLERYAVHTEENTTNYTAEGLLQYNFKGGLTTSFIDQYLRSHDKRATGVSTRLDKFKNNLADLMMSYELSPKFKLSAGYSNYKVNYDAARNDYRDRRDNTFSAYLYYRLSSKSSLFTEYQHIDIAYDMSDWRDSAERHVYGGFQWNITGKSQGRLKAGYITKKFKHGVSGSKSDFVLSLTGLHHFTPKTSLQVTAARRIVEPDIPTSDFSQVHSVACLFKHRFTGKITGNLSLSYNSEQYDGVLSYGGETKERTDRLYSIGPAVKYRFKRWLGAALVYTYNQRSSNFSDFNYINNTFLLRITTAL